MLGFQNALAAVGILLVVTFVITPGAAAQRGRGGRGGIQASDSIERGAGASDSD